MIDVAVIDKNGFRQIPEEEVADRIKKFKLLL